MKHSFQGKAAKCGICDYDLLSHTIAANCEACNSIGECDIYPAPKSKHAMLLCATCYQKESDTNNAIADNVITRTNVSMNEHGAIRSYDLVQQLVRNEDSSIRYSGDIFNAEVTSIAEIKRICMEDESLGNTDERFFKFQNLIAERIENYKKVIFNLDDEKHKLVAQQRAAIESLREYGSQVRAEIRERIKLSDANYTPAPVIKIPKITKPKVNAEDRLIEMLATMKGISKEEAKLQIAQMNAGKS